VDSSDWVVFVNNFNGNPFMITNSVFFDLKV
jgi:hypothetical protein